MKKTLYMVGNAHIDPVWLWRWQDGFSEIRATFRSALDRMNEYPGFIFTSAAAAYYAWIEQNDPGMFEEIRTRVREGRWAIAGGWWVQPDCNIPSGESFARHNLNGQRFFKEKFGITARTGYNVDSFGHSGSLPKILRMGGMERYVFMRPDSNEMAAIPAPLFMWESPDGERVTAFRLPYHYCSWGKELRAHIDRFAAAVDSRGVMCFYGVGNHGGGPTKENLDSIEALRNSEDKDGLELIYASPDMFFDQAIGKVAEDGGVLPVVSGGLFHHASGCYSAHSNVKQWNRKAENRLLTAEKWSVAASVMLGREYPLEDYRRAWRKVLFNQFHDILAGTSIIEAYEDASHDFAYALSVADAHINDAQQAMARMINIPFAEGSRPFVVFNPQAVQAVWPVSLETAGIADDMVLLDDAGVEAPYQVAGASSAAPGRVKIVFVADTPAMGYRVYTLTRREASGRVQPEPRKEDCVLENEWIRAEFSPDAGGLVSLVWKPSDTQMLREPCVAQIIHDESDTWSHGVFRFDDVRGAMRPVGVERIEAGPVRSVVRVTLVYGNSLLIQDYTLFDKLPILFAHTQLNWQEKLTALKLRFAVPHTNVSVTAQEPFGYAHRPPNGEEFPMQQWVDISGTNGQTPGGGVSGLAILNDAKYSYDAHDNAIHLTVLRSPYYAHHLPFEVTAGMAYPVLDQGWQVFTYALMPHDGTAADAGADQAAMLLNAPPEMLPESFHAGAWPGSQSFASVSALAGQGVALTALKLAEDGSGDIIAHMYETRRKHADATMTIMGAADAPARRVALSFAPGQIRCVRIRGDGAEAGDVDFMEENCGK